VTQAIFDNYTQTVVIETVKAVGKEIKLPRATAILLCDNGSSHLADDLFEGWPGLTSG
jgi:hypothetical protein